LQKEHRPRGMRKADDITFLIPLKVIQKLCTHSFGGAV
jgi:hypothetical protein